MSAALYPDPSSPAAEADGLPAPRAYTVQDLGVYLDGSPFVPAALNNSGHVAVHSLAGEARQGEPAWQHGLCFTGYLRLPAGHAYEEPPVTCISPNGFAAGTTAGASGVHFAWCTPRGVFGTEIWPGCSSTVRGINSHGHVVGRVLMAAEGYLISRAFMIGESQTPLLLTPPGGGTTDATAINDAGTVLVNATPLGSDATGTRAWCAQNGRFSPLPSLARNLACAALALTPESRAAGWALTADGERHACLWENGTVVDVGFSQAHASEALALNDQLTVVGRVTDRPGQSRAYRWTPEDGAIALDHLLVTPAGWQLTAAVAINAHGQIAAHGLFHGRPRGVLLHPVARL